MIDQKKLALIHVVKKEIGLSDEEYRNILFRTAGVKSAKDLDEASFHKLMYFLVRSKHYRARKDGLSLKQKLFMVHLAEDMGWTREHLDNFVRKYYQKSGVDDLSRKEAVKAIESLKHARVHFLQQQKKIA